MTRWDSTLRVRGRPFGKTLNTFKRAKPVLFVVEEKVSDGTLLIDLHFADWINCVFARRTGQNYFIEFHWVRQVPQGNLALGLDFDITNICLMEGFRNALRAQDLSPRCLCGYASGDIYRGTEVAIAAKKCCAMMHSGADDGEMLTIGDRAVEGQ